MAKVRPVAPPAIGGKEPAAGVASIAPIAVAFVLFGTFWGGWAVAAADIEHALRVGDGGFGLVLSAALAGAVVSNGVGGALAERYGTGPILQWALPCWGALLIAAAILHPPVALGALIIAALICGGLVDVTMNVAATAELGHTPGRLARFHAWFNIGGAIGAIAAGVALAEVSWRDNWLAVGVIAILLGIACSRLPLPAGEPGDEPTQLLGAVNLLRREHLVLVAAAFAVGALVEGGVDLWGVLYLRNQLHSGLLVGTGSAAAGYVVASVVRIVLGPAAGRGGAARGVMLGAGAATAGLVLLGASSTAWLSGLGLVAAAGGISLSWPLLLALASAASPRPGAVVGAVSAVGYLGLVLGPSIVGFLAASIGLRGALLCLGVGALFVAAAAMVQGRRGPSPAAVAAGASPDQAAS